ncbi:Uncharacterised protein [uncultured archaeon]|nr:Uncharacterised protein [uncultured archaeon]
MKHEHKEWTPELAVRTEEILSKAEKSKPGWIVGVDSALYWVLLFLAIIANFIISVVLVPFLLILKGLPLYFSLFFIGASFGLFFSFILHSLEQLEKEQHIIASIFIPCIALINVGIFAVLSNKLIILLKLATPPHNAILVGAVYVFGYVIPGAFMHLRKK